MNINTQFDYYNVEQLLPCTVHDNSIQWYICTCNDHMCRSNDAYETFSTLVNGTIAIVA